MARTARVKHTTRLTPTMVRLVLDGPDLADLPVGDFSDAYVKLVYPPPGAPYRTAGEFAEQRRSLAPEHRPTLRTYTIRRYDADTTELTIDVVVHGDHGVAGPWAAAARPGDEIILLGPGGGYAPSPEADWHLLIGDESALPAIAATLERLGAGDRAMVFLEVAGADEEQPLPSAAQVDVTWIHRDGADGARGADLLEAVAAALWPAGSVQVFLHGEAGLVKSVRHHLRVDRAVPRPMVSVSGYWRQGRTDEAWRAEKPAWKAEVEADEERAAS